MKRMNHLKVFGIVVAVFTILITIGYTVQRDTSSLPSRMIRDGVSFVQRGYVGVVGTAKGLAINVKDLFDTYEENRLLRQQLFNEQVLSIELEQLKIENESLKELLEIRETLNDFETINAVTIGRNPDQWHNFITIDKGSQEGVEVDMAVLSKEGYLIGRVIEVNQISSRVQLNNYQNTTSKVAAIVSGEPESFGILQGYDSLTGELIMTGVDRDIEIEEGAQVITSGLGGVTPSGLLIGYVDRTEISAEGLTQTLYINSGMDYNSLDFVILVSRKAVSLGDD